MNGFLNVLKPKGMTSRDVVNRVLKTLKPTCGKIKVGHAGTLDPIASGVLVIGVGKATSLIRLLLEGDKKYRGTFLLGKSSESEDTETPLTDHEIPESLNREVLAKTLHDFLGLQKQVPPLYSAIHVNGKRAYALAREGKTFQIDAREIQVFDLQLVDFTSTQFVIDVHCSGGTYIRSLGRDIAKKVGTQAVMSDLIRTAASKFALETATPLDQLDSVEKIQTALFSPKIAIGQMTTLQIDEQECRRFSGGLITHSVAQRLDQLWEGNLPDVSAILEQGGAVDETLLQTALIQNDGELAGIVFFRPHLERSKCWKPLVNFAGK